MAGAHKRRGAPGRAMRGVGLKRIYAAAESSDGYRVLVDRLWPRGISKERAAIDAWLRDLAPSTALRTWFNHDPKRWPQFSRRYRAQLHAHRGLLQELRRKAREQRVTLVYAARDARFNNATVLREALLPTPRKAPRRTAPHRRTASRGRS